MALEILDLSACELFGSLPDWQNGSMQNLRAIFLRDNNLSGMSGPSWSRACPAAACNPKSSNEYTACEHEGSPPLLCPVSMDMIEFCHGHVNPCDD